MSAARFHEFVWHFLRVHRDWLTLHVRSAWCLPGREAELAARLDPLLARVVERESVLLDEAMWAALRAGAQDDFRAGTFSTTDARWQPFVANGLRVGTLRDLPAAVLRHEQGFAPGRCLAIYNGRAEGALRLFDEAGTTLCLTVCSARQDRLAALARTACEGAGWPLMLHQDGAGGCSSVAARPAGDAAQPTVQLVGILLSEVLEVRDFNRVQFEFYRMVEGRRKRVEGRG